MIDRTFQRYVRLHDIGDKPFGSVWTSGFDLSPLGHVHGNWSALGEFTCCKELP